MSMATTVGQYVKFAAVLFIRFYVLVLGAWGVYGLLTGTWVAALGLIFPIAYVGVIMFRGYRAAAKQPQKQQQPAN